MKLRVIGDGTLHGSYVVNAETGERIEGVAGLAFSFETDHLLPTVALRVRDVEIDLQTGRRMVLIDGRPEEAAESAD